MDRKVDPERLNNVDPHLWLPPIENLRVLQEYAEHHFRLRVTAELFVH